MSMSKSVRNKTIDISVEEGKNFLDRCVRFNPISIEEESEDYLKYITDKTVIGNTFEVIKGLPRDSIDLAIVDPPYNLSKDYHGQSFKRMSESDYQDFTVRWVGSVYNFLKDNGTCYVCSDWESSLIIAPILANYFKIQNRITWQRERSRGASHNWKNGLEDIWFCTKCDDFTFNEIKMRCQVKAPYRDRGSDENRDWFGGSEYGKFRYTSMSNFWDDITIPFWSMPENTSNPTQKPEKLIAKLILASSNPGDLVLDPFLGSGTTSVVAKKLGRHYIGIEQNEQYCTWAELRLEEVNYDSTIQGYHDCVFWERGF